MIFSLVGRREGGADIGMGCRSRTWSLGVVGRFAAVLVLATLAAACGSHHHAAALVIAPAAPVQAQQSRTWLARAGQPLLQIDAAAAALVTNPSKSTCANEKVAVTSLLTSASSTPLPEGGDSQLQELLADQTSAVSNLLAACTTAGAPSAVVSSLAQLHATVDRRLGQDGIATLSPAESATTSTGALP